MRFQGRLRCSNIPSPRTFWGRFGTMYNHVTAESRCPLGMPDSTKPTKPRPGKSYFAWWFQCPDCNAIYLVEAARRFFDATGTTLSSTALFSPDDRVPFCAKPPGIVRLAAERETSQRS